MKRHMWSIGASLVLSSSLATVGAAQSSQTLDFELGINSAYDFPVISSLDGFSFDGFWGLNAALFDPAWHGGFLASSGTGVAWGRYASAFSSTPFLLNSFMYGSGWQTDQPITVKGWLNGSEMWSYDLIANLNSTTLFALGENDKDTWIDGVSFTSTGKEFFIDDLTISRPTVTPEPATLAMLGTGLAGMGGLGAFRRRRKVAVT